MNLLKRSQILLVVCLGAALVSPVLAQDPAKTDEVDSQNAARILSTTQPERQIRVIPLQFAQGREVCQTIQTMFKEVVCRPADRDNTLVVAATPEDWRRIAQLLEELERLAESDTQRVQIFQLKRDLPPELLAELTKMARGTGNATFAYDAATRQLVVRGDQRAAKVLAEMIRILDRPAATRPAGNRAALDGPMRVRLVYLVTDDAGEGHYADVPRDLRPVVESLAKVGVDNLWMVAQSMVAVKSGEFTLRAPTADDGELEVSSKPVGGGGYGGGMIDPAGAATFDISLRVTALKPKTGAPQAPGEKPEDYVNVQTRLSMPLGHPVVLAVTPTLSAKHSRVFVLQYLPE